MSKTLKIILVIFLIPSFSWGDMHSDEIVISCKGDQGYNYKTEEEFKEFTEYKYHIVFFEDERGVVVQTSRFDMSAKGTYTDSTISASDEGDIIYDTSMDWSMELNRINGAFRLDFQWTDSVSNELIAWWYEAGKCIKSEKAF